MQSIYSIDEEVSPGSIQAAGAESVEVRDDGGEAQKDVISGSASTKQKAKRRRQFVVDPSSLPPVQISKDFELKQPFRAPDSTTKLVWDHPRHYMLDVVHKYDHHKLCLICLEEGNDRIIYSCAGGNMVKHHKTIHLETTVEFKRIVELKGKTAQITEAKQAVILPVKAKTVGPMDSFVSNTGFDALMKETAKMIVSSGSSLKLVLDPYFQDRDDFIHKFSALEGKGIGSDAWMKYTYEMIIASGSKLELALNPYLQKRDVLVQKVPIEMISRITPESLSSVILEMYEGHWTKFLTQIQSENTRGWSLIFDGWDRDKQFKMLGCTAIVVSAAEAGLTCDKYPIVFRRLLEGSSEESTTGNEEKDDYFGTNASDNMMSTVASSEDMVSEVLNTLKDRGINFDKFTGATSDGEPNAHKCAVMLESYVQHRPANLMDGEGGIVSREEAGVAHLIGLAVRGALEHLTRAELFEASGDFLFPAYKVSGLLCRIRKAIDVMKEEKIWNRMKELAIGIGLPEPEEIKRDNPNDWASSFEMIQRFNRLALGYVMWYMTTDKEVSKDKPKFEIDECLALQQIEFVLQPLMKTWRFLESVETSTTSYSLLIIAGVLLRYGVRINKLGVYDVEGRDNLGVLDKLEFNQVDGEIMKVEDMDPAVYDFLGSLRCHLRYRLVDERMNKNKIEMISMMVDPVGHVFAEAVFGKVLAQSCVDCLQSECRELVVQCESASGGFERLSDWISLVKSGHLHDDDENGTLPISLNRFGIVQSPSQSEEEILFDKEWKMFGVQAARRLNELHNGDGSLVFSLDTILERFEEFNPYVFWTAKRQEEFPRMFKIVKLIAPYVSHSGLKMSVMALDSDYIPSWHKKFTHNPSLLEADIVLRYHFNLQGYKLMEDENDSMGEFE